MEEDILICLELRENNSGRRDQMQGETGIVGRGSKGHGANALRVGGKGMADGCPSATVASYLSNGYICFNV